jgi:hypothetical protein
VREFGEWGPPRISPDGLRGTVAKLDPDLHTADGEFALDLPRLLFQIRPAPQTWNLYDVSPDGQRLLVTLPLEWSNGTAITVLTNWAARFKN